MQWPGWAVRQGADTGRGAEVSGLVTQPLSGAFPKETTTRCASVVEGEL